MARQKHIQEFELEISIDRQLIVMIRPIHPDSTKANIVSLGQFSNATDKSIANSLYSEQISDSFPRSIALQHKNLQTQKNVQATTQAKQRLLSLIKTEANQFTHRLRQTVQNIFKIKYTGQCFYEGQVHPKHKEKRHGQGIMVMSQQEKGDQISFGDWENDLLVKGVFIYQDGSMYQGTFLDGKRHGKGLMLYTNGDSYQGHFYQGEKSGYGTHYYTQKDQKYSGYWENSRMNGEGQYIHANGDRYKGAFANGHRNGPGVLFTPQGHTVTGFFENDDLHCIAVVEYKDGSRYKGTFRKNLKHGIGEMSLPNGVRYIGDFMFGRRNGSGTLYYSNGDSFTGVFKQDKIVEGTLNYKNGDSSSGKFNDQQLIHGFGHYFKHNDWHYYGDFCEGVRHGQGKLIFQNKDYYEGSFVNGVWSGAGTYYMHSEELRVIGTWENNKLVKQVTRFSTKAG